MTTENVSKIGLRLIGEKNIKTIIGNKITPIILSNKKEK